MDSCDRGYMHSPMTHLFQKDAQRYCWGRACWKTEEMVARSAYGGADAERRVAAPVWNAAA